MTPESLQELKARARKLSARAMQCKMELHDLSEELPVNWERILDVAQRTHDAFSALQEARTRIAQSGD